MEKLNWIEKILEWGYQKSRNCDKGRHEWVCKIESGETIYLDKDFPDERYRCTRCGCKKSNT